MSLNVAQNAVRIQTDGTDLVDSRSFFYSAQWKDEIVALRTTAAVPEHLDNNGLADAFVSGELENVFQLVEDMLDLPLEFVPETNAVDSVSHLMMTMSSDSTGDVEVVFPNDSWSTLSSKLKAAIDGTTWRPIAARIELDVVYLTESELEKMEVGGLILLPSTFKDIWQGSFSISDIHLSDSCVFSTVSVASDSDNHYFGPIAVNDTDITGKEIARIWLRDPVMLDTGLLLSDRTSPLVLDIDLAHSVCQCDVSNDKKFTGSLIKIGNGHAFFIESAN